MDELDAIAARVRARAGADARATPAQGPGPWTLEVYPTLRCNLDCAFCDTTDRHRPPVDELPEARWIELVNEAADLGAQRILVLGGGEPLLSPATPAILRHARARGLAGMLTTNGTRLARFVDLLVDIGWDEVHVSIDGASPETHDALRGRPGSFARAVTGLCQLRRARDARGRGAPVLALHTVITVRNVDELADIVRLAHALGCTRVEFDALVAYRPEQRALLLDPAAEARLPARAREALEVAAARGITTTLERFLAPGALHRPAGHGGQGAAGAPQRPPDAGPPPSTRVAPDTTLARTPCLKAWHHLVIGPDGRTAPCCVLAGEGDSVRSGSLAGFWDAGGEHGSDYLRALRAAMAAGAPPARCAECSPNLLAHERAIRGRLGTTLRA